MKTYFKKKVNYKRKFKISKKLSKLKYIRPFIFNKFKQLYNLILFKLFCIKKI